MSDKGPIFDMLSGDLPICTLEKSMSREDIQDYAASLEQYVRAKQRGFIMTVSGWDDVPEGLHEISEAVDFLNMAMDTGFLSLMEVTTTFPYEDNPWKDQMCPGLGAFEVWMIATGKMKGTLDLKTETTNVEVNQEVFGEFIKYLQEESNPTLEKSIKEAKKRGPIENSPAFSLDKGGIKDTSMSEILTGKKKVSVGTQRIDPHAPLDRRRQSWLKKGKK